MRIVGGKVIVCSPGRNFVTLKLETEGGVMYLGDLPGLGVDIEEDLAATFPYQRAYLPVSRLTDGTVHDW
jgi:hypothetical protein